MSFDFIAKKFAKPLPSEPEPVCHFCLGSGWEIYGIGVADPHWRVCEEYGNPEGLPSP